MLIQGPTLLMMLCNVSQSLDEGARFFWESFSMRCWNSSTSSLTVEVIGESRTSSNILLTTCAIVSGCCGGRKLNCETKPSTTTTTAIASSEAFRIAGASGLAAGKAKTVATNVQAASTAA